MDTICDPACGECGISLSPADIHLEDDRDVVEVGDQRIHMGGEYLVSACCGAPVIESEDFPYEARVYD